MRLLLPTLFALIWSLQVSADHHKNPLEISADNLSNIVKIMASDEFEGRAPGTPGEDKTVAYLIAQLQKIGLEPGGAKGSWTQAVPMMRSEVKSPIKMTFSSPETVLSLDQGISVSVDTATALTNITAADLPVVFVGFGANAPEQDWDDYGDIDLTDKLVIYLVNDPDFAAEPDEPVAGRFGNRRMTYYGRWAYKFEEAARRGAFGALVIHETKAAGYDWSVAAAGAGENVSLANKDPKALPVKLQGWLHNDAAHELLATAGHDLDALRVKARQPEFQAFELEGIRFDADLEVDITTFDSQNVLGLIPGSARPDEVIMASAHWDAYGVGAPDEQGRTVRAGANDDALGSAGILELARVIKAQPALERSVLLAFWTAEEAGLVGSMAYAADPIFPIEKTVANFTLDILQTAGAAKDVILVGKGQSELEDDLARVAEAAGRYVTEENLPENGLFYRADHFSMARVGVPVLLMMGIAGGADLVVGGREAGNQWIADYVGNCYHKPCDAWSADWDLTGAVQDIELFHQLISELGNAKRWPAWKQGSEFKALREQSASVRQ
ncbi:MAG: M28 family peptidase [Halieaceae bacterium]|jgi:Zn-dependent M28 family amino/carboxypeptidase|nr:M28 family peptidase [Halieaceae bacterium]